MEQNLVFKVLNALLKEELHARALAKKLNTNHMSVLRKLKLLVKENVLDFKKEGKNKIYFIKKSLEAKNYIYMTEFYKQIELVKKYPQLRRIINEIQLNKKIRLAILFGSYAKFQTKKESDIDIFIETKNRKLKKEIEAISSKLNIKIGTYDKKNNLIREIDKNHVILKGVEYYYEKNKFFD